MIRRIDLETHGELDNGWKHGIAVITAELDGAEIRMSMAVEMKSAWPKNRIMGSEFEIDEKDIGRTTYEQRCELYEQAEAAWEIFSEGYRSSICAIEADGHQYICQMEAFVDDRFPCDDEMIGFTAHAKDLGGNDYWIRWDFEDMGHDDHSNYDFDDIHEIQAW